MQSLDLIQLLGAVVDQPAGELSTLEIDTTHALADAEDAANFFQSRRQKALALLHDRIMRALIDDDLAGGFQVVSNPVLPAAQPIRFRQYQRAGRFVLGKHLAEHAALYAARNHGRNAGERRFFRRAQLGYDSTRSDGA